MQRDSARAHAGESRCHVEGWRKLQRNGMAKDFGWDRAAREYAEIYRTLAGR